MRRYVGSAMYPAKILRQVRIDTLELTAGNNKLCRDHDDVCLSPHLMGSPKYWVAMPTVAPVMQSKAEAL